jgi:hypothetical protein
VVFVQEETENFQNLIEDKIDGFIADRLVAASLAWRNGWQGQMAQRLAGSGRRASRTVGL